MKLTKYQFPKNFHEDLRQNYSKESRERILENMQNVTVFNLEYFSQGYWVKGFFIDSVQQLVDAPLIIYNRGGSKDYGAIGLKTILFRMIPFAALGYPVIATQYTGNMGSEGKDEFGGEQDIQSVVDLFDVAKKIRSFNENKIVMIGESRGGMMTYKVSTRVPWIRLAIINSAAVDISHSYTLRPNLKDFRKDMYNVSSEVENKKRSALYWPEELPNNTKFLVFHGTEDEKTPVDDTLLLINKMILLKKDVQFHLYKDEHCLRSHYKDFKQIAVSTIKNLQ